MTSVNVIGMSFNVISIVLVLVVGGLDVKTGNMSVGLLFSMTIYVQRLYSPIVALGTLFVKIKSLSPIIDKIYKLQYNVDKIKFGNLLPKNELRGDLNFKNVSFSYDGINNVFKNLSFEIKSGDVVGIKGKNGSGKTTIMRLVMRLCDNYNGDIYIDDIKLTSLTKEYIFKNIICMPQDYYLLPEMIKDMLKGKDKVEFLKYLSYMGININESITKKHTSEMKDNKLSLSGGQAQKIALFKVINANKKIYILDEPTSSFDIESTNEFMDHLKSKLRGKTIILISHNSDILKLCDYTITLDQK